MVTVQCHALGGPDNTFSIRLNGVEVATSDMFVLDTSTDAQLGGVYQCVVTNGAGTGSATTGVNSKSHKQSVTLIMCVLAAKIFYQITYLQQLPQHRHNY